MINTLYISSYFISFIILHIYNIDLKKINIKLYEEINIKVWIKIYSLISIALIHFIWIISTLFLDYNDNTLIYGFPIFLLIPYIIYIADEFKNEDKNIVSEKINKYLNYITSLYIGIIIIIIMLPLDTKKYIINYIKKILNKLF